MLANAEQREVLKQSLIEKVGPWAFQSFSKDKWKDAPDRLIIEGVLLQAKPVVRYELLKIYSLQQIKDVWDKYVVIQKLHDHSNLWAAENLFQSRNPYRYVREHRLRSLRKRESYGYGLTV
jgi:hypothetical protein